MQPQDTDANDAAISVAGIELRVAGAEQAAGAQAIAGAMAGALRAALEQAAHDDALAGGVAVDRLVIDLPPTELRGEALGELIARRVVAEIRSAAARGWT